jgi:ABC-type uncharacterized transport system substrate-binding protein
MWPFDHYRRQLHRRDRVLNRKLAFFFITLLSIATAPWAAAAARIDIVIPANTVAMADFARALQHALQQSPAIGPVSIRTVEEAGTAVNAGALAIAVGDNMLPWVFAADNPYSARLAFYVGADEFRRAGAAPQISAIYREQPLRRQLRLAKLLLPQLQRVAVIHRAAAAPDLAGLSRSSGLQVNGATVEPGSHWAKTLSRLLGDNDVLLGIEDNALYNRDTIRSILLTTYRHGKVLIGPNQAFVNAGSLASCYTAPDQFQRQLRVTVEHYLEHRALPPPAYPEHYRIAVNRQVAASLGLQLPDRATIDRQMHGHQIHGTGECGDGC